METMIFILVLLVVFGIPTILTMTDKSKPSQSTHNKEFEIRRKKEFHGEWYYTVWQRNKCLFGWGDWYCWTEASTICGGFESYVPKAYDTLAKAERAVPRGGLIVRKPIMTSNKIQIIIK